MKGEFSVAGFLVNFFKDYKGQLVACVALQDTTVEVLREQYLTGEGSANAFRNEPKKQGACLMKERDYQHCL